MVVCKFWQQGSCRYGDSCRFEHPATLRAPPTSGNRFTPLQNNPNSGNNNSQNRNPPAQELPYKLDKAAILVDLTTERPQWILSAYGPGRAAPTQLFGGPREQSFEEMRLLHYIGMAAGNPQQAVEEAEKLFQSALQQTQAAANNLDAAIDFIINGEKVHPNRLDIVNQSTATGIRPSGNPLSSHPSPFPPTPATNPFTASSQPAAPVLAPAISGAFGQPSVLGSRPNPFGAPAPIPAFGTPTQLGSTNAFGQPSALGQRPNPFGAPANTLANAPVATPFGQPPTSVSQSQQPSHSIFGNPLQPPSASIFGKATENIPSPFGAPPVQASPLNHTLTQTPFGTPPPSTQAPFSGQPSANPFGAIKSPQPPNPFGAAPVSTALKPFGVTTTNPAPTSNPFGNPNPSTTPRANPFGNPTSSSPSTPSAFGQPQAAALSVSNSLNTTLLPQHSAGANGTSSGGPGIGERNQDVRSYSTRDQTGRLLTFKGKRVVYKGDKAGVQRPDGKWQKIMFPNGAPPPPAIPGTELAPESYANNAALKAEFDHAARHGVFQDGKMPMIPPLKEWCGYDF